MNDRLELACGDTMGKHGGFKTLPDDNEVSKNSDMDIKYEKELLSEQFSLIENIIDRETMNSDTSEESEENSKEGGEKYCLGSSIEEDNTTVRGEALKRLTVENVLALNDLHDVFEFSIEHDINIDKLETIEECQERFLLHIEKEKCGITKKHQVKKILYTKLNLVIGS